MPKGGSRAGAGRPKKRAVGHKTPAVAAPMPPPGELSEAEARVWRQWEGLAREMKTLTGPTVPGFVLLCQVAVEVEQMRSVISAQGWQVDGAVHPLATGYRGHVLRLEQLLARFGLAASGRAVAIPKAADAPDEISKWQRLLTHRGDDDFYTTASPRRRAN